VIEGLAQDARAQLTQDGFARDKMQIDVTIDMRYRGQAFELAVPFDPGTDDGAILKQRFDRLYLKRYGFERSGHPIEIVTLRVAAAGLVPEPRLTLGAVVQQTEGWIPTRRLYWEGKWIDGCPILRREHLYQGMTAQGPIVVEEFGSTTLVPPGWQMRIDEFGNLRLDRHRAE
jgi:N-methylhydantoinase A